MFTRYFTLRVKGVAALWRRSRWILTCCTRLAGGARPQPVAAPPPSVRRLDRPAAPPPPPRVFSRSVLPGGTVGDHRQGSVQLTSRRKSDETWGEEGGGQDVLFLLLTRKQMMLPGRFVSSLAASC